MTDEPDTISVNPEDVRLVLALAAAARHDRTIDMAARIGSAARDTAAYRSHDRLQTQLREYDTDTTDQ